MSIEKHKAFLDSLNGEKGLPEKFYRMLIPGVDVWQEGDEFLMTHDQWMKNTWEKAFAFKVVMPEEIGRRAESRQIPDLKEKVKAFGLACMDAETDFICKNFDTSESGQAAVEAPYQLRQVLRALCEPEKDSKEVKP